MGNCAKWRAGFVSDLEIQPKKRTEIKQTATK